ncbi:tyrosine recombinase XerS [Enterococcus faecium]|uniref:tyrosine recombinase XerS n=1 Tax=Enterococcus faecium TaxID=1352 RepID=UPI000CF34FE0|nr:tyrosine recombinase XerS [Enterococcus faecium]EGP4808727.1 tyrosine recombinase XerS [Enterococcus faecium]EGP5496704.1 tyrosine recombinase XerS [Enterococcus faecium]EME3512103.1 tyrosine recombinase XerS [Enterococcus faecium]EMF0347015.1 tyrosine recombinase XerS [Enterococcus faecium]PQG42718.1 tyrosine recombinase XerS [Enterococcus faecium]
MKNTEIYQKIDTIILHMPDYIKDFVQDREDKDQSPRTTLEYLKNYKLFYEWLLSESIVPDTSITSIRQLTAYDLNLYKSHLKRRAKENVKKDTTKAKLEDNNNLGLSTSTINRNITALKVLFKYLSKSSNNPLGKPYLDNNPMDQVATITDKTTLAARANAIEKKLFLDEDTQNYLDYIANEYKKTLSKRALIYYQRDVERDLAINALILGSGLRLSEVVNINLDDLSLDKNNVVVTRKGNKRDAVHIAAFAMEYLANYLAIRKERYKVTENEKALFLAIYQGEAKRISGIAIERMVAKYSKGFRVQVSPHKLRHTLATRLYQQTNSLVLTAQQLGHSSTNTTTLYTHIDNAATIDALNSL